VARGLPTGRALFECQICLRARYSTHMSGNHTPGPTILACPDARVAIRSVDGRTVHFHREASPECAHCDIGADTTDAKFLRFVLLKSHDSRAIGLEILCLGSQLSVRPREEEGFADQFVEGVDVGAQLRGTNPHFTINDVRIRCPNEHRLHDSSI